MEHVQPPVSYEFKFTNQPPPLPRNDNQVRALVESRSNNFYWLRGIGTKNGEVFLAHVINRASELAHKQALFRVKAFVISGAMALGSAVGHYWYRKRVWLLSSAIMYPVTVVVGLFSFRAYRAGGALQDWEELEAEVYAADNTEVAEKYNRIAKYIVFDETAEGSCAFNVKPQFRAGLQELGSLMRLPGDGWLRWLYLHRACALLAAGSHTVFSRKRLKSDPLASDIHDQKDRDEVLKIVRQVSSVLAACQRDLLRREIPLCAARLPAECARWRKRNWAMRLWKQPPVDKARDLANLALSHEDFEKYIAILNWANIEFNLNLSPITTRSAG
jgi:hypothetical protein